MGIPGFFYWLNNTYKHIYNSNIIKNKINFDYNNNFNTDYLFFDANSIIHHISSKIILENSNISNNDLEKLIISNVIYYIDTIINLIKPTKLIYISIDGVVPMGKIKQQKIRRYKTIFDKNIKLLLKDNMNITQNCNFNWSSSCISPGTEFMNKLNKEFQKYIDIKKNNTYNNKVTFIYSSSNEIGEGEHKILSYIKYYINDVNSSISIYGLDADLIFLCLQLNNNIFILRDDTRQDIKTNTISIISVLDVKKMIIELFKNINILKNKLPDYIKNKLNINNINYNDEKLINDFIFLCFLLGNDFIPHLLSIQLKIIKNNNYLYNILDLLICIYHSTICDSIIDNNIQYLVDIYPNMNINFEIFLDILKNISDIEFNIINDIYNYENVNYSNVENIQDINKLDNMNLNFNDNKIINHLGLSNYVYKKDILDLINCNITNYNNFSSNFINNYNSYYFNDLDINKVIENYIEGLFWTFFYYFKDCNNWLWFYKFNSSPLLYNIIRYIDVKLLKNIFNKISINHYNKGIINPYEQLCIILPSNLHYLINDKYKTIIDKYLSYYYKDEIKIDFFNKNKLWQCSPIFDNLNLFEILSILKLYIKCKITNKENITTIISYKY